MILCPTCRYDRAGLPDSTPCPECGTVPDRALAESLLVNAPARFVGRIRLGARIAAACIPARALSLLAVGGIAVIWPDAAVPALVIAAATVSLPAGIAWWLLTTPDPAFRRALPMGRSRITARTLAAIQIMIALVMPWGLLMPSRDLTAGIQLAALAAIWPALAIVGVAYTTELARKAQNPKLEATARGLLKYTAIASLTLAAGLVAALLTALIPILFVITVPLAVPYLIFLGLLLLFALIAGAVLQFRLADAVR
ncbi:MAG: hypothetical protein AAGF47_04720 [Planctomycetota bacterium]